MSLFRRQKPRLPDFIGIGAMRSGTSWLRKQLQRHPQIWTATPKELHFFDRHFSDEPASYAKHFSTAPKDATVGEITPAYAILEDDRIATIKSWMPDLKLLFIMRDPVERAWSHARKDFPQFRDKPASEATAEELLTFAQLPEVALRGDYLACLNRWRRHFSPDQIWCGFLEDAASDPAAVLRGLSRFLAVDPEQGLDLSAASQRENARPEAEMPAQFREHLEHTLYANNSALSDLLERDLPWA